MAEYKNYHDICNREYAQSIGLRVSGEMRIVRQPKSANPTSQPTI
jgi:hypothetical protein